MGNTYQRGKQLKAIREFALLQVMEDKSLTTSTLMPILAKEFGNKLDGISYDTFSNWIFIGRNDGKNPYTRENRKKQKGIIMIQTTGTLSNKKPTFDEVLSSFSSQQELANFLLDGFLQIAKERNELKENHVVSVLPLEDKIRELTEENKLLKERLKIVISERDRCMKIHNESLVSSQSNTNRKPKTIDDALAIIRNEKVDIRVPKRGEII